MRAKRYNQWVGQKVRRTTDGRVGQVVDSGGMNTWWLVEWEDGSKTKTPERLLEVLPDETRPRA